MLPPKTLPTVVCFEVSPHGLTFNHPDPFFFYTHIIIELCFFDVIFAQDLDITISLSYASKS